MKTRLKNLICFGILASLVIAVFVARVWPFFSNIREQNRAHDTVFMPLEDLRGTYLYNGFGANRLEFSDNSLLADDNVERLLLLNEVPQELHLTVTINSQNVTDSSINILAQLKTVDRLVVDKSGLTEDGIRHLTSELPPGTIPPNELRNEDSPAGN